MTKTAIALMLIMMAAPVAAQEPVRPVPDWLSYPAAATAPTVALVKALRSDHKGCRIGQLAISEVVVNTIVLTAKHFIVSPRPCIGCAPDGMPSGHTANSAIGTVSNWRVGVTMSIATGVLRSEAGANRHTKRQIVVGEIVGLLGDLSGQLLRCE